MGRKDEILTEAAIYVSTNWETNIPNVLIESFEKGAEWADMNPKYHWISTNQDLPHNYEDLISEPDFRTVKVLVVDRDTKEISLDYMENTVKNIWRFVNTNPIYWMPIPNLP